MVDVRNPEWKEIIIQDVIPRILKAGFDGLFLDTIDTAAHLHAKHPKKYIGIKKAMIELIRDIKEHYPNLFLISNNGFLILEEIAPYLSVKEYLKEK